MWITPQNKVDFQAQNVENFSTFYKQCGKVDNSNNPLDKALFLKIIHIL